jgi:hypothetical protein
MQPGDNEKPAPGSPARSLRGKASENRRSLIRLAVVLAVALIAGLVAWLVVANGGNSSTSSNTKSTIVSEQGLQTLITAIGEPIFWVGPEQGMRYGVEQRSGGQVYVRYLSAKMKLDTTSTLTVGTYPMANAYATTVALSKKSGWKQLATGTGGVAAFTSSARPRSVYLAQPGLNYQIEVYDPAPGAAAALVQAGRALPVTQGERLGLTLTALKTKLATLGTTVYWIGSKPGVTYEYTRSPGGDVYLRYLPKGVAVGASGAYPTVGTYPMSNATAATRTAARRAGSVRVKLAGAEAFYSKSRPTSVYVAFTGSNYQIEVYDPVAARALAAVKSGLVKPVG